MKKQTILTSEELITALKSGNVLYNRHHDSDGCIEYLFLDNNHFDIRGWKTAFGTIADRLADTIMFPEKWNIVNDFNMSMGYPYPWSTTFKGNIK